MVYHMGDQAAFVMCLGKVWVQDRPRQYLGQSFHVGMLHVLCRPVDYWMFLVHQEEVGYSSVRANERHMSALMQ